jgi:uracil-DNA glycosylase family 4
MVVEQAPNWVDDGEQTGFVSSGAQMVVGALKRHGVHPSQVYFTYMVKCFPNKVKGKAGGVPEFALAKCQDYLVEEIAAVQPVVIVALGANVMKWFGIKGGIRINNGATFYTKFGPVIPIISPGSLTKRKNDAPIFATQMASVATFIGGGKVPPPYIEAEEWYIGAN